MIYFFLYLSQLVYNLRIISNILSSNKEDKKTLFDNENFVYVNLDASPDVTLIGLIIFFPS